MIDEAVAYAEMGIPVIPLWGITPRGFCSCRKGQGCPSPGKHPRSSGWQKVRADANETERIFMDARTHRVPLNIGLRLSSAGLAVIDVDSEDGAELLATLVPEHELADMPCARTGRGTHYFVRTRRAPGLIGPGLEIKSENVVAPPSLVAGGAQREWLTGGALERIGDVPDLPASLERHVRPAPVVVGGTSRRATSVSILPPPEVIAEMLIKHGAPRELVNKHILGGAA